MDNQYRPFDDRIVDRLSSYNSWPNGDYESLPYSDFFRYFIDVQSDGESIVGMSKDTQFELSYHPSFYIHPPGEQSLPKTVFRGEIFISSDLDLGTIIIYTNEGEFVYTQAR